MSTRNRRARHRVTVVSSLPGNATPEEVEEAERKFERASVMAHLTPNQVKKLQEHAHRGGRFDGKSRNNRTRRARRESAIREQE